MASFIEHKIPTAFYRLEKLAIMAGKISLTIFCMLLATGLFTSTGYHSSGAENPLTTPAQDLDILRNAINLYDAQNPPLTGTSLEPLFPRYLQELPKDPWGNPYLVDTRTGFICSYGKDQKAGGTDDDADHYAYYKAPPAATITRQRNQLNIAISEPVQLYPNKLLETFLFKRSRPSWLQSDYISPIQINEQFHHQWTLSLAPSRKTTTHTVIVSCNKSAPYSCYKYKELEADLTYEPTSIIQLKGIWIAPLDRGPLDPTIYGAKTKKYRLRPTLEVAEDLSRGEQMILGTFIQPTSFP